MIVDMMRNDLGRVADDRDRSGSRALFDVERYPTVWQMTSTVTAETDATPRRRSWPRCIPSASVTGAPKVSTMEILRGPGAGAARDLHRRDRLCRARTATRQFNVAIRTAVVDQRRQRPSFGVGSGIVWDSERGRRVRRVPAEGRGAEPRAAGVRAARDDALVARPRDSICSNGICAGLASRRSTSASHPTNAGSPMRWNAPCQEPPAPCGSACAWRRTAPRPWSAPPCRCEVGPYE